MAQCNHGAGLTPNFGLTGYKTHRLLYHGGSKEKGGDDWRGAGLEQRGRKMKGKRQKNGGKIQEALRGDRQLTLGGRVAAREKSDFLLVL